MADLPLAAVERLIRKSGAERVSEDASEALADVLEEYAISIGQKAVLLAKHAGRKTITGEDVRLASRG